MSRKPTVPPSVHCTPDGEAGTFPFGANAESDPPADANDAEQVVSGAENSPPRPAADAAPDPFDPVALRLTGDFSASAGVKKALLAVPVRKPDKSWFVQVHPDEAYRLSTAVIELKEDRETYLVAPDLWPDLAAEATFRPKMLATAINRQGVLFLWELNLPRADGRADEWSRTALEAVELATKGWVRISANMALGAYDVFQATGQLGEPIWPATPFKELLRVAFKDRYIDTLDHPVLRRLRGEV